MDPFHCGAVSAVLKPKAVLRPALSMTLARKPNVLDHAERREVQRAPSLWIKCLPDSFPTRF